MDIKERSVWRVSSGNESRWFAGELGARDYAGDRFDDVDGPIPFVEQISMSEMLVHLNTLEASRD